MGDVTVASSMGEICDVGGSSSESINLLGLGVCVVSRGILLSLTLGFYMTKHFATHSI